MVHRSREARQRPKAGFYASIYIYMSAPYARRCYSSASLILLQLCNLDGCTLRRMFCSCIACSSVVSSALWCFFCGHSAACRLAFTIASVLFPPLCCALCHAVPCCAMRIRIIASLKTVARLIKINQTFWKHCGHLHP